jgi:hypothetical protein
MDNPTDFFAWLATQPAFIEVAVGAFFCLAVAPVLLAAFALAVTAVENFAEVHIRALAAFLLLHGGDGRHTFRLPTGLLGLRAPIARAKPSPQANS